MGYRRSTARICPGPAWWRLLAAIRPAPCCPVCLSCGPGWWNSAAFLSIPSPGSPGRKLEDGLLFAEIASNARAYKVADHRHTPEIEQELAQAAGTAVKISFIPHLIPTVRGILTSVLMRLRAPLDGAAAQAILEDAYADAPFVRVLPEGGGRAAAGREERKDDDEEEEEDQDDMRTALYS